MDSGELLQRIEKLNQIGIALSAERDKTKLLELILQAAKELTYSDAGTIYTVTPDNKLRFEIIRNDTLNFFWTKGAPNHLFPTSDIPLYREEWQPNQQMIVAYAVIHGKAVNVADAYHSDLFDFSGTRAFDQKTGYRSISMLAVPMRDHEKTIIGVLQLINAQDPKEGKTVPFTDQDLHLVESLASQAAVAMTNQGLVEELKVLFESVVKMLADAIDEKSPVTGRHCQRVPIIAMLLALAVNNDKGGKFQEVHFSSDELYELEIAALLHDCGKVTTPVHIMEKSKKLEGIWDRMELVNTRLEVLQRDAHIASLQQVLDAALHLDSSYRDRLAHRMEEMEQQRVNRIKALKEIQAVIEEANEGRESADAKSQERLPEIAKHSFEGMQGQKVPLLTDAELQALSVAHGTLTDQERQIIQNHVAMTIKMLQDLPYPKHLRSVAEIAGCHHERVDGKGYPKGLMRSDMSLRARILCIADIFEALTAPDRPYKKPMPLSQALTVMQKLKDEGHLDPDLVDLFIRQKVYALYGRKHLAKEQMDCD